MMRALSTFAIVIVSTLISLGSPEAAVRQPQAGLGKFDGNWSVVIVTRRGDCSPSLRYPVAIVGSSLSNGGGSLVDITGRVSPNGAVSVRVSGMGQTASGSGRLAGLRGGGSWAGGACNGTWSAQRV